MPLTVEQTIVEVKKYAADLPKIIGDYSSKSADIKKIQTGFAAGSQVIMSQAGVIDAKYVKAKAELKAKYEADLKLLEAEAKAEHATLSKSAEEIITKHIGSLDVPYMVLEISNVAKGCKMLADSCDKYLKDLPKAAGNSSLRKEAITMTDKTGKDYRSQQKQWATLGESAQKTVASFNVGIAELAKGK